MPVRRSAVALLLLASLAVVAAQSPAPQLQSITQDDLRKDLYFLASDALQGRLTGTFGNAAAAEWIRHRFDRLGLKPLGNARGFEQPFQMMTAVLGDANAVRMLEASGLNAVLKLRQDYYPQRFSGNADVKAAVVYAGYGIHSPTHRHDDYRSAARGKIVLALEGEPGAQDPASPFDGVVASRAGESLTKALAAQAAGALGLVLVADVHAVRPGPASDFGAQASRAWPAEPGRAPRVTLMTWAEQVRIPVLTVSVATAERLVTGTGKSLIDLARSADQPGGVTPLPLPGVELHLRTDLERRALPGHNVVAMLEGSDPALKAEYVLIGGHYDHDGTDGQRTWNGADDDGSGTVGMLEAAEAFALAAQAGQRPRRSVIFAAWNAEEQGLLGSWAFVEQAPVPLDRIAAVINLDMIGRNEEVPAGDDGRFRGLEPQSAESNANSLHAVGLSRSPDLRAAVERANAATRLELETVFDNHVQNIIRRSDNWPFLQRGVPAVFFTTGLHPDYHTPNDRPERINYPKMEKVVRLVYQLAWDLANAEVRPRLAGPTAPATASR